MKKLGIILDVRVPLRRKTVDGSEEIHPVKNLLQWNQSLKMFWVMISRRSSWKIIELMKILWKKKSTECQASGKKLWDQYVVPWRECQTKVGSAQVNNSQQKLLFMSSVL